MVAAALDVQITFEHEEGVLHHLFGPWNTTLLSGVVRHIERSRDGKGYVIRVEEEGWKMSVDPFERVACIGVYVELQMWTRTTLAIVC